LSGRLLEIRAGDLRLDRSEVRRLLVHHGVLLDDGELSLLVDRTEGWAAGVRLAALALAGAPDPGAAVARFAGDDRAVADYLAAEVLGRLDEQERRLLQLCALPEQLTAELAVEITGDTAALRLLEDLHRADVFVLGPSRPGGWYRIHALLRGYLLAELARTEVPAVPALHARIARWFAGRGHLSWAIEHALASRDDALAVDLLRAHGPSLLAEGRARTLHSLIGAGAAAVRAESAVRRLDTLAVLDIEEGAPLPGPRSPAHDRLARTPATDGEAPEALDSLVALHRARHDLGASAAVLRTSAVPDDRDDDLGLLVSLNRGIVLLMAGRLDEAEADLARAQALSDGSGNGYGSLRARAYRTALLAARGRFGEAWDMADEAIRTAARVPGRGRPEIAGLVLLAAHSARQRLDRAVARRLTDRAAAMMDGAADLDTLLSLRSLGIVLDVEDGGDPLEGCRRLRACWATAAGQSLSAPLVVHLVFSEHRCAWLAGRLDWAREAQVRLRSLGPSGEAEVLGATEHLARGRLDAARHRVAPVLDGTVPCLMPLAQQQGWLIEALLADQVGQRERSHEALRRALTMGAESGALRAFLDVPGIVGLLDENVARFGRLDPLVERIRSAARERPDHTFVPMTPKELRLLSDLPAQLTFEEIAGRHQVSVNTVKTHVRSIYQKLGATSRRDAITTARRRGLL
jgi:LuxR family maltose regulon positive regulatory protein